MRIVALDPLHEFVLAHHPPKQPSANPAGILRPDYSRIEPRGARCRDEDMALRALRQRKSPAAWAELHQDLAIDDPGSIALFVRLGRRRKVLKAAEQVFLAHTVEADLAVVA
ncbi:hypothetical protein MGN01_12220 [Methylobacterium gnaphalii]|uniref:Uncharacterized protein n=1 Tax=Methylobacterium gnaphalii TaxID=1010610 RepID=A0A512JHE0_9HYPH|nr:hypothetical protein MGN01_12220 [Methylobacterium gnaphalii]GLS51754.1 hypothetical protein GCM10007885_46150 [Methylobacterium gnaphalii]